MLEDRGHQEDDFVVVVVVEVTDEGLGLSGCLVATAICSIFGLFWVVGCAFGVSATAAATTLCLGFSLTTGGRDGFSSFLLLIAATLAWL